MSNFKVGQKIRLCPKRYNKEICRDWEGAEIVEEDSNRVWFLQPKTNIRGMAYRDNVYVLYNIKINTRKLY